MTKTLKTSKKSLLQAIIIYYISHDKEFKLRKKPDQEKKAYWLYQLAIMVRNQQIYTNSKRYVRSNIKKALTFMSKSKLILKKNKEDYIAIDIAKQIIKNNISNQIVFNIINLKDLK